MDHKNLGESSLHYIVCHNGKYMDPGNAGIYDLNNIGKPDGDILYIDTGLSIVVTKPTSTAHSTTHR